MPTAAGVALTKARAHARRDGGVARRSRAALRPKTLKIGLGSALANYWLVRRLTAFASASPDIGIELCIVEGDVPGPRPRSRRADPVDSKGRRAQHIYPAPDVRRDGVPGGGPLFAAARPAAARARCARHPAGAAQGHRRPQRRRGMVVAGVVRTAPGVTTPVRSGLRFDNLGTAITAALQGSGVVLARSLLVHDALAAKQLSRVVSPDWDMACSKAHVIRWPAALASDRRVALFSDWIVREAQRTSLQ